MVKSFISLDITAIFFYTTNLHNANTKSKLNKNTTEPYLMFYDQTWETEKVKKKKKLNKLNSW